MKRLGSISRASLAENHHGRNTGLLNWPGCGARRAGCIRGYYGLRLLSCRLNLCHDKRMFTALSLNKPSYMMMMTQHAGLSIMPR